MSEFARPMPRADVVAYALLDEMVLYQDERGLVLSLNRTARAIWELCDGQRSLQEIVAELGRELDCSAPAELERLMVDVQTAVSELYRSGVLDMAT